MATKELSARRRKIRRDWVDGPSWSRWDGTVEADTPPNWAGDYHSWEAVLDDLLLRLKIPRPASKFVARCHDAGLTPREMIAHLLRGEAMYADERLGGHKP